MGKKKYVQKKRQQETITWKLGAYRRDSSNEGYVMPLEGTITGIQDLNPAWPTGVDPVSEGDNHVRNTKDAVQKSFPGMTGAWTTSSAISCNGVNVNSGQVTNLGTPVNPTDAARKGDVDALNTKIDDNTADISTNAANIAVNATNISNNAANIAQNTSDIAANTQALAGQRYSGGSVSGTGAILNNSTGDFTVSKEGTGVYRIDFTDSASTAFAQTLSAMIESSVAIQRYAVVDIRDANTIAVITVNGANGNAIDSQFNFMRFVHA